MEPDFLGNLGVGLSENWQMGMKVALICVSPTQSLIGSDASMALMDVDAEAVSVSVAVEVSNPTTTDGGDVGPPPSLRSVASPPDGSTGLPNAKKRRVTLADEQLCACRASPVGGQAAISVRRGGKIPSILVLLVITLLSKVTLDIHEILRRCIPFPTIPCGVRTGDELEPDEVS